MEYFPHVFNLPGDRVNSDIITDYVHYRIEGCIQDYKSKDETAQYLSDKSGILPEITRFVWYHLEKANPDFFSWYKEHLEEIRNAPSEKVTAVAQTTPSNGETKTASKPDEELAEASTSYTEPDKRPRARRSKAKKAKELQKQRPISPMRWLTETAPNDASSQVPQEATATTNAADAQITVEKVSSKARRSKAKKKAKQNKQLRHASHQQQQQAQDSPSTETAPNPERAEVLSQVTSTETASNAERAEVLSQESIHIADAEITLKQTSASLQQLESIIEQVHPLLSNVLVPPRSAAKQRSWEQVRGDYEQAEMLQDLNQEVQQETQRSDSPGNEASDNSSEEDTLYD